MNIEIHPDGIVIDGTPHLGLYTPDISSQMIASGPRTRITLQTTGATITTTPDLLDPDNAPADEASMRMYWEQNLRDKRAAAIIADQYRGRD